MKIIVNGKEKEFDEGITLSGIINALKLDLTGMIVERNLEVIPISDYDSTIVKEGDKIELIRLVAGG